MPTADNKNETKATADSPAAAMAELATEGLPPWATKSLDVAKKYQNVFYAVATVGLLTWAVLKFQARRKEEKINAGWSELGQAQSVDALRALLEKYKGLAIEPYIRLRIGNKLVEEEKLDEALKEFGELKAKFNETLPGKLAGQQEKSVQESKAWSGKDGMLEKKLNELRAAEKALAPIPTPGNRVKIDDKELPRVELDLSTGKVLIELDELDAPNATAAFIREVEKNYYNPTNIYKIEKDTAVFMGDPMPDGSAPRLFTIPFESSKMPAAAGTVALVRDLPPEGQPDTDVLKNTGSTKFVIFTGDVPQYAGKFLVIGRVVEGLDAVRKLTLLDKLREAKVIQKRSHPYLPKENAVEKPPEPPKEPGK
ncbi:MAG: peptidyl-prolyl [Planctomycetota bacterium]|nr:MAG: peptidyl-prolyl [Planctomycetota bacterium]